MSIFWWEYTCGIKADVIPPLQMASYYVSVVHEKAGSERFQ